MTSPTLTLPLAVPPGRTVFTAGRPSGPSCNNKPSWMFDCEQSSSTLYTSPPRGYFLIISSSVAARTIKEDRRIARAGAVVDAWTARAPRTCARAESALVVSIFIALHKLMLFVLFVSSYRILGRVIRLHGMK
eukprot:CAMPEP_0179699734 /NCGR_PEP_ID=MMETSP0937-20121108/894_1 /TAXON_ID=548131 ORGANISM="Ostreococcus mediterraneus, Strain clade-D-RCC2593" /NCGR_SAMPLE_ID=MMETSP0937 /ASSEMBLY_ACC=CAM_ASM_000575 /LENGTH=132 /DNA_ID=CAMNT_0021572805 /DNA_START=8 /DNA_END=406 /DNA_ORIENTATION=+